jgi:heme A synthase
MIAAQISDDARARRFALFTWAFLAYTVLVILWGAFVRATGSGAGCGDHWPLCNGEVLPRSPAVETLVELTHRITSGLSWLLAFVAVVWARRVHPRRSPVRRAAWMSLFFMTTEGLVGAALVLRQLVGQDASAERGFWMAAHLVNTFLLLGTMTLLSWTASGRPAPRLSPRIGALFGVALAAVLVVGISGAITALGDTLFPVSSLAEGIAQDLDPSAHLFIQLRVLHPILGLTAGAAVLFGIGWVFATRPTPLIRRLCVGVGGLFAAQVGLGFLNLALLAPVWLQIVHLLVADLIWIGLVLLAAATLVERPEAGLSEATP